MTLTDREIEMIDKLLSSPDRRHVTVQSSLLIRAFEGGKDSHRDLRSILLGYLSESSVAPGP